MFLGLNLGLSGWLGTRRKGITYSSERWYRQMNLVTPLHFSADGINTTQIMKSSRSWSSNMNTTTPTKLN